MLVLRVRCVDDGRELLLERHGVDEHSIVVAELKKLVLQHRHDLSRSSNVRNARHPSAGLADCFVLLRGQILADPDVVDLNALTRSDFFVFVSDAASSELKASSSSEMHREDASAATFAVLRSQLVDMGFSTEVAAQALSKSHNNISSAAALLVNGEMDAVVGTTGSMHTETAATNVVAPYPSIAPLRSVVQDEDMKRLQEVAATDSWQALLLLKEQFSSDVLTRLNENPVATLQLLLLPASTPTAPPMAVEMKQCNEDAIDDGLESRAGIGSCSTSRAKDAIDRLVAMGFSRDLVKLLYESCGGDEQLTANALLQTL